MNCSNCSFAGSYMSFGGHGNTFYGVRCKVTSETIFQVNRDDAKMLSIELLGDYRDEEEWYPSAVDTLALDRIMPGPWDDWREIWEEDRAAFFRHVLLEPQECICAAQDVQNFIDCRHEYVDDLRKKQVSANQELAEYLRDMDHAAVLVQAIA